MVGSKFIIVTGGKCTRASPNVARSSNLRQLHPRRDTSTHEPIKRSTGSKRPLCERHQGSRACDAGAPSPAANMAPQPSPPIHAGVKRPHSSSTASGQIPHKKRRVHHVLQHVQTRPKDIEPAPQDPVFAQGQLLKSIGAALLMAGFDSVKASALEMFRAEVEECEGGR